MKERGCYLWHPSAEQQTPNSTPSKQSGNPALDRLGVVCSLSGSKAPNIAAVFIMGPNRPWVRAQAFDPKSKIEPSPTKKHERLPETQGR